MFFSNEQPYIVQTEFTAFPYTVQSAYRFCVTHDVRVTCTVGCESVTCSYCISRHYGVVSLNFLLFTLVYILGVTVGLIRVGS